MKSRGGAITCVRLYTLRVKRGLRIMIQITDNGVEPSVVAGAGAGVGGGGAVAVDAEVQAGAGAGAEAEAEAEAGVAVEVVTEIVTIELIWIEGGPALEVATLGNVESASNTSEMGVAEEVATADSITLITTPETAVIEEAGIAMQR